MSIKSKTTAYADSVTHKLEPASAGTWSEWMDSELNAEPWDSPKSGEFVDPQQVEMPRSLQPAEWRRFQHLGNVVTPTVFEPVFGYPDLIVNNSHLLHSEFMRYFVSTLINVQYCGRNGLNIENPSENFSWNFEGHCWQGWHQVYSLNKAGKGATHRPIFNPKGRYVVRLFLMGLWRRFLIDDLVPVDERGRPLLPRTANCAELWPMLLAKAMLKIAALSWSPEREIVDCSLVACLTGWIDLSLNVAHLSPRDQWEFLTKYAKHFEWPQEKKTEDTSTLSKDQGKGSKKKGTAEAKKLQVPEEPQPTQLFLSLDDTRDASAEEIPGISPCWSHQIYVGLSRDIPLDPAEVKPPLAKWKLHRWLDWAISRGVIDAAEYFVPIRHLLVISPLRECKGDVAYAYDGFEGENRDRPSLQKTLTSNEQSPGKKRTAATPGSLKDKPNESALTDISLWGDFNKLSLHLREIHLFYLQKFFKYSTEVSNAKKSDLTNRDMKKSGKFLSPGSLTQVDSYEYRDNAAQSRNEPLYLLVDSIEDKFFLVNFSTMILPQDTPKILQARRNSSLVVERHSWLDGTPGNLLEAEIRTRGTRSTVFQLEPGRHLLRLFVSTESSFHATILSDTPFQTGDRLKMHRLMTAESESVKEAAQKINVGVKKAFESFGTAIYATELRLHYRSYMPDSSKSAEIASKKIVKNIHRHFSEELANILETKVPAAELPNIQRALRIFFVDPSIGRHVKRTRYDENEGSEPDEGSQRLENRSATVVQSFFRMILIKCYIRIHQPSHRGHGRVKEALLRALQLLSYESPAEILLRALIKRESAYKRLYPWANDLKNVIQVQELKGRVPNVLPDQWVPILRTGVNAPKSKTVLAAFDLFTSLPDYTVRVFANDTKREIVRVAKNVAPTTYRYRKSGYTVFAYGRSDFQRFRELEWSLHLTTIKGEPALHRLEDAEAALPVKSEVPPLTVQEISNTYVPNIQRCLLKFVVRVRSNCQLSLRLGTSYEGVKGKLRVANEAGSTVAEIEGGANVVLPLVFLVHVWSNEKKVSLDSEEKLRKSRRSLTARSGGSLSHRSSNASKRSSRELSQDVEKWTPYTIEAFVREDSWPLTRAEWAAVREARARSSDVDRRLGRSSTVSKLLRSERPRSRQISRKSFEFREALEKPYWTLHIVTEGGNELEVFEDRSREDKVSELKRSWKTDETGRSKRGDELRERFLEDNCPAIASSAVDTPNGSIDDRVSRAIETADEFCEEISSEAKRTLEPPADLGNYLPKLDLSIYMERGDEEEQSWVKTEFDEETLRNQRAINVLDFQELQSAFVEEATELVNSRRDRYLRLFERHSERSVYRARAVDEAYQLRRAYIEEMKSTARSVKSNVGKHKKP